MKEPVEYFEIQMETWGLVAYLFQPCSDKMALNEESLRIRIANLEHAGYDASMSREALISMTALKETLTICPPMRKSNGESGI